MLQSSLAQVREHIPGRIACRNRLEYSLSPRIQKLIWGLFAGRCAICHKELIRDESTGGQSLVGQVAHIVGNNPGSARYDFPLDRARRDEPDNLMLLCLEHHKQIDDNELLYPVAEPCRMRKNYLTWLEGQLERNTPWNMAVSAFAYLNLPRLAEYALSQGYKIQCQELPTAHSLHSLGFALNNVMRACDTTLSNMDIESIPIENIRFVHEGYTGSLVRFDRLRFRTRNMNFQPSDRFPDYVFTGNLDTDPHIYRDFGTWKLIINIDPRWITTSTAFTMFRPSGGHALFAGFARLTNIDLENSQVTATALALGVPKSTIQSALDVEPPAPSIDFLALEDDVTKGRNRRWHGPIEHCDVCGKDFAQESYMIDGPVCRGGPWGNICTGCYSNSALPLGVGKGQLFRREGSVWSLVGGYPVALEAEED